MMHVARLAGFDDEADFRPRAVAYKVVVDGRDAKGTGSESGAHSSLTPRSLRIRNL